MRHRRFKPVDHQRDPLRDDVKQGLGGIGGGHFVTRDGDGPSPSYAARLEDEDYQPIQAQNGEWLLT